MRGLRMALAVTAVAALVMSTAPAQPPGRGKGGGFGMQMFQRAGALALLTNASVQTELKLTDDQKAKFKEFQDKQEAKMREARADGGVDRERMTEMFRESAEQAEKLVKDTLKKDQFQRYSEIKLQRAGVGALSEKDVQTSLKLNDDQKEKIKGISEELAADMRELRQGAAGGGGNFAEMRTKSEALGKEAMEKAQKVLTADQKTKFKEMLGKPFEIKFEEMRRPGGGDDNPRKGKGGDRKSTEKKKDDGKTPPKSNPKIDD
jgi:Spy/CpxP family protein refolding chaperone